MLIRIQNILERGLGLSPSETWTSGRLAASAALALLVAGAVPLAVYALSRSDDGGLRPVILSAVVLPAAWLALRESAFLFDYFIIVSALNRLLRRVLDWSTATYDPQPLSSTMAPLIGALAALAVARRWPSLPTFARRAALCLMAGLVYGLAMGWQHRTGALFALANYVMPLAFLFYPMAVRATPEVVDRWLRTTVTVGLVVAVYGWVQWAVVPPWDAAWVRWSRMYTSMGQPIPFRMGICSTLESRGPFAWFMATVGIIMLAGRQWRWPWGWAGAAVVAGAAVLSTARTAWGFLILSVGVYALLRGGRGIAQVGLACAAVMAVVVAALPYLPESDRLVSRVESLQNIGQDGSFRGRVTIAQHGSWMILTTPQGFGLGSTGLASKLTQTGGVIGDNGYLELLANFGLPGFAALAVGVGIIVVHVAEQRRQTNADHAHLALAMLAGGLVFLIIGNWVSGPYAAVVFALLGATAMPTTRSTLAFSTRS